MVDSETMRLFGFWSGVLVLKLLAMPGLTARQRFKKKVFANHEDTLMLKTKARVAYDDQDVERVRRSHLNDLENVVPWIAITYIWINTNPTYFTASLAIRGFVLSRIMHTLSYAVYPKQPFRALSFFVGLGITFYEACCVVAHYY